MNGRARAHVHSRLTAFRLWLATRKAHRFLVAAVLLSLGAFPIPALSAQEETFSFDIPAGDATDAVRAFSRQSHLQVIYAVEVLRGVHTRVVRGNFTAEEALQRLFSNTDLEAVQDEKTKAFAVRRRPSRRRKSDSVSAPETQPDEPLEMDSFRISNRRDAGLITQTILRTDAEAPIYHEVINRKQIEELGVTSIAELMTTVIGYSGEGMENLQSSVNLAADGTGTFVYSGAFLKLRGFDSSRTAVLLNGRRLPNNIDSRGPDLSRIPLAAVERIDVLPFSGSALYGENVIGGAVNIVLRKDYVGHSLSWMAGTTTRGGGSEFSITAVDGFTSASGKTKATLIFDYEQRRALRLGDRDFLQRGYNAEALLRQWQASRAINAQTSDDYRRAFATLLPSSPAIVVSLNPQIGLGIPSHPNQTWTLIPSGQDGTDLSSGAFDGIPDIAVTKPRAARSILRRPTETYGFTAQFEHSLVPEKLELYSEVSYSRAEDRFQSPQYINPLTIPGSDPRNPFSNQGLSATPSVVIFLDPVDIPDNRYDQIREGIRVVAGVRGDLSSNWRWTIDVSADRTTTKTTIDSPNIPLNAWLAYARGRTTTPFDLYSPFADHEVFPVSSSVIETYFRYRSETSSQSSIYGLNARIFGSAFRLPAGTANVSFRGEYRQEDERSHTSVDLNRDFFTMMGDLTGVESRAEGLQSSEHGNFTALAVELDAPLLGPRWRPLPLHGVSLNWGARAARPGYAEGKVTQTAGIKVEPTGWFALRACYSEGYSAPSVTSRQAPLSSTRATILVTDPTTSPFPTTNYKLIQGGNSELRDETSHATVAGFILKPPVLPGLSLTVDSWNIDAENGVRVLHPQEILDNSQFASRVTRQLLPSDLPSGESKLTLISIDDRPINVARMNSRGVDIALSYRWSNYDVGFIDTSLTLGLVQRYTEQISTGEPAQDRLGQVGEPTRVGSAAAPQLPQRGRASVAWQRKNLRLGVTATYISSYRLESATSFVGPGTVIDPLVAQNVASSLIWDVQATYALSLHSKSILARAVGRTTFSLGVRNLFDRAPAFRFDGVSLYSQFEDPRMRFVYFRMERTW